MKKNNKLGIKWKLFGYFALFAIMMLILLWAFQVVLLDDFYKSIKITSIQSVAESVARNADKENAEETIATIALKHDMCVIVAKEDGEILISYENTPSCIIHRLSLEQYQAFVQKAKANGGSYLQQFSGLYLKSDFSALLAEAQTKQTSDIQNILYIKTVESKTNGAVAVLINTAITPVDATVQTIRIQLFFVTGIMLVLALFLALMISRHISQPMIRMNRAAKQLAAGSFEINFRASGYKEIDELGESLSYAAQELSKVDALRKELIANISHDLRTPLTMITGYAEMMRDFPEESSPENTQVIIDEAKRLTSLVNDVMDISKIEAGAEKFHPAVYQITSSASAILARYEKLIGNSGYVFHFSYDREAYVYADELKITQVLYNLINNAVTYTGEDKQVYITQTVESSRVKFAITDTGDGISKDQLSVIWERYYKVPKEHKRAQLGTGLGLSIVKSILRMHEGAACGVESEPGRGSTFWFSLPCVPPPDQEKNGSQDM